MAARATWKPGSTSRRPGSHPSAKKSAAQNHWPPWPIWWNLICWALLSNELRQTSRRNKLADEPTDCCVPTPTPVMLHAVEEPQISRECWSYKQSYRTLQNRITVPTLNSAPFRGIRRLILRKICSPFTNVIFTIHTVYPDKNDIHTYVAIFHISGSFES